MGSENSKPFLLPATGLVTGNLTELWQLMCEGSQLRISGKGFLAPKKEAVVLNNPPFLPQNSHFRLSYPDLGSHLAGTGGDNLNAKPTFWKMAEW